VTNFDVCLKVGSGAVVDASDECVFRAARAGLVVEEKGLLTAHDVQLTDCCLVVKDPSGSGISLKRVHGEFTTVVTSNDKEELFKKAKICDSDGCDPDSLIAVLSYPA